MKNIEEKETRQDEQTEENTDLTVTEQKRALKGAYRRFAIPGYLKQILIVMLIKPNHISNR